MPNPFKKITKNSEDSKKEWDGVKTTSETKSKTCETCGAPRPKKTDLRACDFCGFSFMNITAKIKPDN